MDKAGHNNNNQGEKVDKSRPRFQLRLFVTGRTPRSQQAIQNIRQICEEYLSGEYELEVIDVYQNPAQAREHQILAVPTLLKELPPPLRKVVGDLSEKEKVLEGLNIQPKEKAGTQERNS
ncbi:MAG: circadian clock KaiB family protein [Desulfosalsimonas sp.]|uniref:circadian clock KaiB family protein n=1 Tax=Desulfosalsimonas sp. TaxID=3073848 RepID=UPI0039711166